MAVRLPYWTPRRVRQPLNSRRYSNLHPSFGATQKGGLSGWGIRLSADGQPQEGSTLVRVRADLVRTELARKGGCVAGWIAASGQLLMQGGGVFEAGQSMLSAMVWHFF